MITTDLTGNLSDHMIRYAVCRTVAEKNGYQWGINPIVSHDYFGGREQMYFFEDIDYGIEINTPYGQLPEDVINIWEEKQEHFSTHTYHHFQPDIFDVSDNTKLIIYCCHDSRYLIKEKVEKWFTIKEDYQHHTKQILKENNIELDENTCIISARGGEYIGVSSLFLTKNYWNNAIQYMKQINPDMKFICITEDQRFYSTFFDFPVYHLGIHHDYYILNNAKNLIISNSGFGLFPTFLNKNVKNVIAPEHWSRHNLGIWSNSDVWTFGNEKWFWINREGNISQYVNN